MFNVSRETYMKGEEQMNNIKVYVTGSISERTEIESIANVLKHEGYIVEMAQLEDDRPFKDLVSQYFNCIEWADIIYVKTNIFGSVSDCTAYELEYAKRLEKKIVFI